jgi:hypothetical protein
MKVIRCVPAALVAGTLGLLVACSSSSTTTGTQTFAGATSNTNASTIAITGTGVVADHGSLILNNSSTNKAVLQMSDGNVNVTHSKGNNNGNGTTTVDQAKCSVKNVVSGTYTVAGGTGKYAGATGNGNYKISFVGTFALTDGKCQVTQSSTPVSGTEAFHATGPLTLKG